MREEMMETVSSSMLFRLAHSSSIDLAMDKQGEGTQRSIPKISH